MGVPRLAWLLCVVALLFVGCGGSPQGPTGPTSFHLGGSVNGVNGKLVLVNGSDAVVVSSDGAFLFDALVPDKTSFDVQVGVQPENQRCTVDGGAGTIAGKDVLNITVTCKHGSDGVPVSIGGFVSGLGVGSLTLLLHKSEAVLVSANRALTFPDGLPTGGT